MQNTSTEEVRWEDFRKESRAGRWTVSPSGQKFEDLGDGFTLVNGETLTCVSNGGSPLSGFGVKPNQN